MNICVRIACALALLLEVSWSIGSPKDSCKQLGVASTHPQARLLDPSGQLSLGPIDFGEFNVSNDYGVDLVEIPTGYKIAFSPVGLGVQSCKSQECLILKISTLKCPGFTIFDVFHGLTVRAGDMRPFRYGSLKPMRPPVMLVGGGLEFSLPGSDEEVGVKAYFDPRVIGVLVWHGASRQ